MGQPIYGIVESIRTRYVLSLSIESDLPTHEATYGVIAHLRAQTKYVFDVMDNMLQLVKNSLPGVRIANCS